ncbi:MAG: hypothetical protein KDA61_17240 [Planctomycetales bacterium]|nr:hypothetical protein [Planctomycetales bacterium]
MSFSQVSNKAGVVRRLSNQLGTAATEGMKAAEEAATRRWINTLRRDAELRPATLGALKCVVEW